MVSIQLLDFVAKSPILFLMVFSTAVDNAFFARLSAIFQLNLKILVRDVEAYDAVVIQRK